MFVIGALYAVFVESFASFYYCFVLVFSVDFLFFLYLFFFSSRRRHTRCLSDWSSDVCSSDLWGLLLTLGGMEFAAAQNPAGAAPASFDVLEYRIEGNTVLATRLIEKAVLPFLGPARTIDDVEKARASLQEAYRAAGYATVSVSIPEQRVTDGVVVLQVLEAPISQVRIVGSRYYSHGQILEQVPAIAPGKVPYFPDVQEQLGGLNRFGDRRVVPVLKPGQTPGTTAIDLNVEDQSPFSAAFELNNNYSPST